jgi:4-carboxymuconolactone decarboxylase
MPRQSVLTGRTGDCRTGPEPLRLIQLPVINRIDDFMMAFQNITTEWCWGYAWTRPGLDRKTRSLLNLAMLTALKAPNEIKLHVKGALANGVTVDEIKEVLLHATVYSGIPAGLEAFKAAHEVLKAEGALDKK